LDESESIDGDDWETVKTFSKRLIKAVGVSKFGNRAGVASFAADARIRIKCDQHSTTESFVNAIDALDQKGIMV